MIYLLGTIVFCLISVRSLNQGHKIYVEMTGAVTKVLAVVFSIVGVAAFGLAYQASCQFIAYLKEVI